MKKRTALQAIIGSKCPKCRQGNMFEHSAMSLTKYTKMYSHCPVCHLRYGREPSFFDGAMYISYGFTVAILATFGVATYVLGSDPDAWVYLTVVSIALVFFSRFTFRYARTLMLHLFGGVAYDPEMEETEKNNTVDK